MSDFDPAIRNASWWSGDSRMAAQGKASQAILIKQGKLEREDISDQEHVRMGHVMQPIIGRLAQDKLGIELKDADYALTHPKEQWMRSHFDFISADGSVLVEAKNYNWNTRSKFDADTGIMPDADRAQLIHEACVHNVDTIYLAVLLGGQEFITIRQDVTQEMKDEHIKQMAVYWGHVAAGTLPEPQDTDQCRLSYPVSTDDICVANADVETWITALAHAQKQRKGLEDYEDILKTKLMSAMQKKGVLQSIDGRVLATWKSAKESTRFNVDLFKNSYPEMYASFLYTTPGSRRFNLK